jgi:hypothetical protein
LSTVPQENQQKAYGNYAGADPRGEEKIKKKREARRIIRRRIRV